jgi:DNA-binding MarR family transcriptional regulator
LASIRRVEVGRALREAHYAFRLAAQDQLRRVQMSLPLVGVLIDLGDEDGLSSAELARRGAVTAQTMNQLVARLAARGLVERRRHDTHGRILTLHLTPVGRRMLERCELIGADVERTMLRSFAPGERRRLLHDLRRCTEALAK